MIIYSVTVKVENDIFEDWLQWMKENHIPDVLKTGLFTECRVSRVVPKLGEPKDGVTYNMQYLCRSMKDLQVYQSHYAKALQQQHEERYAGKCLAFRTILDLETTIVE